MKLRFAPVKLNSLNRITIPYYMRRGLCIGDSCTVYVRKNGGLSSYDFPAEIRPNWEILIPKNIRDYTGVSFDVSVVKDSNANESSDIQQ